jgi:hypothetical protein
LAALFAGLDVSNDERPADAYFPPYGMEQYQQPQYDMAAQYGHGGGYGHPGPYLQQWANAAAPPLIY